MEDNNFSVFDNDGNEYKAKVIDIFSVKEYPDNDYLMYSLGKNVGDSEQVNISRVVICGDGLDLVGIEDETEWACVNKAIEEIIASFGGAENA